MSTEVEIGGLKVAFPFKPYDIQVEYMSKVISCCQNQENGLLESPTGTGKTLSLLCATLAWLTAENKKGRVAKLITNAKVNKKASTEFSGSNPVLVSSSLQSEAYKTTEFTKYRVIYTSRTHKQLKQAQAEMKRTAYADQLIAVCLASRDHYCVNEQVRNLTSLSEKNQSCAVRRRTQSYLTDPSDDGSKGCTFYRSVGQGQGANDYSDFIRHFQTLNLGQRGAVIDIEEMVEAGIQSNACPYYAALFAATTEKEDVAADVVFAPYNYIFSGIDSLSLANTIIIFDEGHNIEQTCEEAGSASITTITLNHCVTGLVALAEEPLAISIYEQEEKYKFLKTESLRELADFVKGLADAISNRGQSAGSSDSERKTVCKPPITWLLSLITSTLTIPRGEDPVTKETKKEILGSQSQLFREINQLFIESKYVLYVKGQKSDFSKTFLTAINALAETLEIIFPAGCAGGQTYTKFMSDNYRAAITKLDKDGWRLDLFCLNPAVAIDKVMNAGARCIIITSGTLAPMNSFEAELETQFRHKLSNPHVIGKDQLMIFPVAKYGNCILDGSYKASYGNSMYYRSLGVAIANYVKVIPKGVLIFFKSYASMKTSIDSWQKDGILSQIDSVKKVLEEPRDARSFNATLDDFKKHVDSGRGAILLAVYRGKVSEGLDLADDYCRGVIVVGLPFPNWTDPHVELKRQYLDAKNDVRLSKDRWYSNQMLRAVNQAIGRVVRHCNDYGVAILIDSSYSAHMKSLSVWLQDFIRSPDEFRSQTFSNFFRSNACRTKSMFPIFQQKPTKRPDAPAVLPKLTTVSNEYRGSDRCAMAAKRSKVNFTFKTAPKSGDPNNQFSIFMSESGHDLKALLPKEKMSQLLIIMRDMRDKRNVAAFTAGVQKTFFGLPRDKIAKYIKGISFILDTTDRRTFLKHFGIADVLQN